ncbi:Mpr protein [Nocardia sputorum]|nr:Mpr protein [Nocardia sputorum]
MSQPPPPSPGPDTGSGYPTQGVPTPPPGYQQPGFQQPGFPPPPGYAPPQQPKKRAIWPWILIGAMILLCGGCFGIVGLSVNESKTDGKSPAGKNVAAVGSAVRDGQFEFKVTAIDPPVASVGSGVLEEKARGEFLVMHVDITNTGKEPRSYFDSNQKLIDDQGREYANNSAAARRLGADTWTSDLNPGFTIQVKIVFDVPPGTVPAVLELHDSMLSGGVKVALR